MLGVLALFFGIFDGRWVTVLSLLPILAIHRTDSLHGLGDWKKSAVYLAVFGFCFCALWKGGIYWNKQRDNDPALSEIRIMRDKILTAIAAKSDTANSPSQQRLSPSVPLVASSLSPRDEGLKIANDITNFVKNRQKTMPSPETTEYMLETWRLFGQKFEGRLADELDKLGQRGSQNEELKAEVQYLSHSTGREEAILGIADKVRVLALLWPPEGFYTKTSDLDLANFALAEASKIDGMTSESMLKLRTTGNTAERDFFAWHFKECCLDQVEYLRAAMLERLGPVGIDNEEMSAFNGRGGITEVEQHLESELSSVLWYMPRFRAMAAKLKEKAGSTQSH